MAIVRWQIHPVVVSGAGGHLHSTIELTWGLILGLLRNIPEELASLRAGGWQHTMGTDLRGATLGVGARQHGQARRRHRPGFRHEDRRLEHEHDPRGRRGLRLRARLQGRAVHALGRGHNPPKAARRAQPRPADIEAVQLYDAFTINTILFLEDLGFCRKGDGGAFVSGGRIAPGGALPVNTNGGGLSCVHPGMYGLFTMVEAAEQLMGHAGARQVKDARLALAHGDGGELSSQATLILGTEETL